MSKNVILNGQTYNGVSEVSLPISGGTALFKDEDEIIEPTGTKQITANGNDINVIEYARVDVNVPNPSSGSLSITENGTYDVTDKASAVVNVPTGGGHNPSISVAASGLVTASCGGESATHQLSSSDDADFIASNIKDGVTLFGLLGEYEGSGGGTAPFVVAEGDYTPPSDTKEIFINAALPPDDYIVIVLSKECRESAPKSNIMVYGYCHIKTNNGDFPIAYLSNRMTVKMTDGTESYYTDNKHFDFVMSGGQIKVGISNQNEAYFEGGKKYGYIVMGYSNENI